MFCSYCGKQNNPEARFCICCGMMLTAQNKSQMPKKRRKIGILLGIGMSVLAIGIVLLSLIHI